MTICLFCYGFCLRFSMFWVEIQRYSGSGGGVGGGWGGGGGGGREGRGGGNWCYCDVN
jgi:hypothetical protein